MANGTKEEVTKGLGLSDVLKALGNIPEDQLQDTILNLQNKGRVSMIRETAEVKRYVESVGTHVTAILVAVHKLNDAQTEGKEVSPLSIANIEEQLNKLNLAGYQQNAMATPYEPIVGRGRKAGSTATAAPQKAKASKGTNAEFEAWKASQGKGEGTAPVAKKRGRPVGSKNSPKTANDGGTPEAPIAKKRGRPAGTTKAVMAERNAQGQMAA